MWWFPVSESVCVCVCVCERERESERDTNHSDLVFGLLQVLRLLSNILLNFGDFCLHCRSPLLFFRHWQSWTNNEENHLMLLTSAFSSQSKYHVNSNTSLVWPWGSFTTGAGGDGFCATSGVVIVGWGGGDGTADGAGVIEGIGCLGAMLAVGEKKEGCSMGVGVRIGVCKTDAGGNPVNARGGDGWSRGCDDGGWSNAEGGGERRWSRMGGDALGREAAGDVWNCAWCGVERMLEGGPPYFEESDGWWVKGIRNAKIKGAHEWMTQPISSISKSGVGLVSVRICFQLIWIIHVPASQ